MAKKGKKGKKKGTGGGDGDDNPSIGDTAGKATEPLSVAESILSFQ